MLTAQELGFILHSKNRMKELLLIVHCGLFGLAFV